MASQSTNICPKCALPAPAGQRFCANCGTGIEGGSNKPTELTPFSVYDASLPDMETRSSVPPPPPPVGAQSQPIFPPQNYPPPAPSYGTPAPGYQAALQGPMPGYQLPEELLSPQRPAGIPLKDSSKGVLGQIGCAMLSLILVGLLLCGGLSYLVYYLVSSHQSKSNVQNMVNSTFSARQLSMELGAASLAKTLSFANPSMDRAVPGLPGYGQENFNALFVSGRLIALYLE